MKTSVREYRTSQAPRACRRGFTLVELVVAVGITSILMVAIGSVILIAGSAVPESRGPSEAVVEAGAGLEQIAAELQYALSFAEHSLHAVRFNVADRDGDGSPEAIRYAWSGTPGAPLMRQYNDAAPVEVLSDVRDFQLNYDLKTISEEAATENQSPETLLSFYDDQVHLAGFPIDSSTWPGQFFRPLLPLGAVGWRVTRVKFRARIRGQPTGMTKVQLRLPIPGDTPSSIVLEEKYMDEASLTISYMWKEFAFANVSRPASTRGLCLVLQHAGGRYPADIQYRKSNVLAPGTAFLHTSDAGSSWSADHTRAMLFYVYGTVTTRGAPVTEQTYSVTGVRLKLWVGDDPAGRTETGVEVLNRPEVIGP